MRDDPASDFPWHLESRFDSRGEPEGRRLHRTVLLAVITSLILHLVLILVFSDIRVSLADLDLPETISFRTPKVEVTGESLNPRPETDTVSKLDVANIPDLVEEKVLDLTEIQDRIPEDREIEITPTVKQPENLSPGSEASAGLALESLDLTDFENSLESISDRSLRAPDLPANVSEDHPIMMAEPDGKSAGITRDLLEKAAKGNEGLSDKFSTLEELMGVPGGQLTDRTKPIYMPSDLLFDFNEDRLREGAKTSLMMLGILIDRNPDTLFIIEGHTDTIGSDERNVDLSRRRALAVSSWLQGSLRIPDERIRVEGLGESRPLVAPQGSIEEQQPNRRVEIRMVRRANAPGEAPSGRSLPPRRPSVLDGLRPAPSGGTEIRPARPVEEQGGAPPVLPARLIEP
jgi:outer membrane protein OmpA-like peptidoglycan-associated protein